MSSSALYTRLWGFESLGVSLNRPVKLLALVQGRAWHGARSKVGPERKEAHMCPLNPFGIERINSLVNRRGNNPYASSNSYQTYGKGCGLHTFHK